MDEVEGAILLHGFVNFACVVNCVTLVMLENNALLQVGSLHLLTLNLMVSHHKIWRTHRLTALRSFLIELLVFVNVDMGFRDVGSVFVCTYLIVLK